jgi:bacteriorhodopsin
VFRGLYLVLALIAISIFPLFALIRRASFESRRWAESSYGTLGQAVESDDEDEE